MNLTQRQDRAKREAEKFNAAHPVGTLARFWRGTREGEGALGRTTSEAFVLGGHTAVVMLDSSGGCIALTHVAVLDEELPAEISRRGTEAQR